MSDAINIKDSDILVVIDVQRDFCAGGALAVPNADSVIEPINKLIEKFNHVVLTQDWHPSEHKSFHTSHYGKEAFETVQMPYGEQVLWPEHAVAGSVGAEFHPALNTSTARAIFRKGTNLNVDSYSAFYENDQKTSTGLSGYLRQGGFSRIFLTGIVAEYCVGFSALDGSSEGFDVFVLTDATAAFENEKFLPMMKLWDDCGIVRTVSSKLMFEET